MGEWLSLGNIGFRVGVMGEGRGEREGEGLAKPAVK